MRSDVAGEKRTKWELGEGRFMWDWRAAARASLRAKKTEAPRKKGGSPTALEECTATCGEGKGGGGFDGCGARGYWRGLRRGSHGTRVWRSAHCVRVRVEV
eukprot:scaffold9787_cov96-Isochrysis_galbana.AAC.2